MSYPRVDRASKRCQQFVMSLLVVAIILPPAHSANAAEILLRNDTIPAGGTNNPLLAFLQGEQTATWHTAPVTGNIVGVQVQWDSLFGGNPASLEMFVNIYAGGTFPTPGPLLAQIPGPLLNDASANEMRHLDPPTNAVPLLVPVTAGQTFVVALEYQNTNSGNQFGSGVEIDQDGIQAGANSVFVLPGGWADAIPLGVTGDFGIRAIVQQIPEPISSTLLSFGLALSLLVFRQR